MFFLKIKLYLFKQRWRLFFSMLHCKHTITRAICSHNRIHSGLWNKYYLCRLCSNQCWI